MPIIKRYPNRKLYDTAARQYISLEGIAELIRRGEDVAVVDYATGEDVTALTLTQVIVELERLRAGFLPGPVLTGLIRSGGNTLAGLARSLMAPLDLLRQVDDEIERRVQRLIGLGELAASEGQRLAEKLRSVGVQGAESAEDEALALEVARRILPTRADVTALSDLLDRLAGQVDALAASRMTGWPDAPEPHDSG